MKLPQTLKSNERGVALSQDGEFIGYENVVTLSDEELYQEQLAAEFNAAHEQAILALKNWDSLTLAQKNTVLKGLVKWALWKDGWLKLGVLE